jgi:uncharacterized membrane protein
MPFLDIAVTVCIGLLIGTEFAVSAFINPIVWKLDDRAQATAVRLFAERLGTAMPFWYAVSLLLLGLETLLRHHEPGFVLLIAASIIWAVVILLTLLFLVPINNRMVRLPSDSFPQEARREHKKWDTLHRLRVAALIIAFVCFLLASHL